MTYQAVMQRVVDATGRAGRSSDEVTVVAVSKTMTSKQIMGLYEQGHRDFGENRSDEMAWKAGELPQDIRWHFVGSLQSRKAREIRDVTHLLHSMDRPSLARAWLKGPGRPPPCLLQVNVGAEAQKSGVSYGDVEELLAILGELDIETKGLMAIPPIPETPEDSRAHFRSLADLRSRLSAQHPELVELSMGMSDDFEVAIEEGASIIRVGRAIFGPRRSTGD